MSYHLFNPNQLSTANPVPNVPLILSDNETLLARILTHPSVTPTLRHRFQSNHQLAQVFERFLEADAALIEVETMSTILETHEEEHGTPAIFLTYLDQTINRRQDHRVIILRALIAFGAIPAAPQLLSRGQNPVSTVRATNLCQNCGYVGHFPVQCPLYRCPICSLFAPNHRFEECPHRITNGNHAFQGPRRAQPIIPLRPRGSNLLFPTAEPPRPPSPADSDSSTGSLPPLVLPQPPPVRPISAMSTDRPTNRQRITMDFATLDTLPVPPPVNDRIEDTTGGELVYVTPLPQTSDRAPNGIHPSVDSDSPSPQQNPLLQWHEGRLLDTDGNPATVPMDEQGNVHYRLMEDGIIRNVAEQGPIFTGFERQVGEMNLQLSDRIFRQTGFQRTPHHRHED